MPNRNGRGPLGNNTPGKMMGKCNWEKRLANQGKPVDADSHTEMNSPTDLPNTGGRGLALGRGRRLGYNGRGFGRGAWCGRRSGFGHGQS